MALLKFKRSAVPAKVPALNDLALGELAINTYDGKVYTKKDNGTASIVEVGGGVGVTSFNTRSGAVTLSGSDVTTALGYTPANISGPTFSNGVTVNNGGNQVLIAYDGNLEIVRAAGGAYIDFKDSTAEDFDVRLQASGNQLNISAAGGLTLNGAGVLTGITSGQVTTALGYTPANKAGDTFTGSVTIPELFVSDNTPTFTSSAFQYHLHQSPHVAYVKQTGGYNWYWRRNSTGTLSGTDEVEDMSLTEGGNLIVRSDVRAPLFYDTPDTSWFLDPSSTSVLNVVRANAIQHVNGTSAITLTDGSYLYLKSPDNGVRLYLGGADPANYYDNDTHYFRNRATTIRAELTNGDGFKVGPNASGQYTRFGGNGGATDMCTLSASNGNLHIDAKAANNLYLSWYNTATTYVGGEIAATVFRDRDNAAYYVDPTGTSNLVGLTVANTITGSVSGTAGSISGFNNPTTAPTANTTVYRDALGDIAAREIILSSGLSAQTPTVLVSMYPTTNQMVRTTPAAVAASLQSSIQSAASGTWGINITGNSVTSNGLGTRYDGGQRLNPQDYFGQGLGLRVAMTAAAGVWSDTLWINGYAGGDVLNMCALHTSRQATPRMWISSQASNGTSYGTLYEFPSLGYNSGNTAGLYAGAYYDSPNTAYFVDPASESNLNITRTYIGARDGNANWNTGFQNTPPYTKAYHGDISTGGPAGTWWFYESMRHSNASNYWGTQIAWGWEDNSNRLMQRNVSGNSFSAWVEYLSTGGRTYNGDLLMTGSIRSTASDVRAPIFYDQNDTSTYINPNGESWIKGDLKFSRVSPSGDNDCFGGLELREVSLVGASQSAATYAPRLNFHWGARAAATIYMDAGGSFVFGGQGDITNNRRTIFCNEVYASGNVTAYYSDDRLKTRKGNIKNALDIVSKLNGFRYTNNEVAKSYGYEGDEVQLGVSAQEVEAVLPEIVRQAAFDVDLDDPKHGSKSGENYKTVQYDRLVPLLIEAIKELSLKVKTLEEKDK
jgi:hypothetical protein